MEREALAALGADGVADGAVRLTRQADLRFAGQGSELTLALPADRLDAAALPALVGAFRGAYRWSYGYDLGDDAIELVNAAGGEPAARQAPARRLISPDPAYARKKAVATA